MEKMDLTGFEDLYTFRERKNKGNLEDFFTELISLMLSLSPKFRDCFFKFIDFDINKYGSEIISVTQEIEESEDSDKQFDKPDLKIFISEKEYEKDLPKIICEHKIDHEIKKSQLKNHYTTYNKKGCVEFRLITPKKPTYEEVSEFKFIHLYWNNLFEIINKEIFNNSFYTHNNYTEYINKRNIPTNTEEKLIYFFLEFMNYCELNVYDDKYYLNEYGEFNLFCSKIVNAISGYYSILHKLKILMPGSKGSGLNKWVQDGFIYVSKGDVEYGIQVDNDSKLWQYSYNYKTKKRNNDIVNIENLNSIETIKLNELLYDLFRLFENLLMDVSNKIKYKIKEDSIKITTNSKKNQLEIDYIINNEEHCFDLIINKDKILIDYDKDKEIIIDSYNFITIFIKLKEFIESEKFSKG